MVQQGVERKLTAILSADVKGYSRLMGEDEVATIRTLTAYREVITSLIQQHRGRVVDTPGDNVLAEFASVVDAVQCAVEVQQALKSRNPELPDHRKMEFRIGINLGDVVVEGERIYGDGVNIAARVEGLAEGGGICLSGTAYDQVENKLAVEYKFLGEHAVKNIAKPVRAYRVVLEPRATVARENATRLELPAQPSIAVLPFENMSGDAAQEYLSDGIADSITTQLYKVPNLFVIARTSSSTYKGKAVTVQQVGRELGVQYVLEGSVQKAGERIRINAQLIEAATGIHRWAEKYDRELKDMFAVQDEITRKVVTELAAEVAWGEVAHGWTRATESYEAFDCYLQADKLILRLEKESNVRGREWLTKAIELDPRFARAIAYLGNTHLLDSMYGWVRDPAASFKQAEELAKRAIAIDDGTYLGHMVLSRIYTLQGLYGEAVAEGERAVEVEPNNSVAVTGLARTMVLAGRPEEGWELIRKAMRLSPYPPAYYRLEAAQASYLTGRYEAAIAECKKYLESQPHGPTGRQAWQWLIASYMEVGRVDEARAKVRKFLEEHPDASIRTLTEQTKRLSFKDYGFLDRQIEALRKAGLPE